MESKEHAKRYLVCLVGPDGALKQVDPEKQDTKDSEPHSLADPTEQHKRQRSEEDRSLKLFWGRLCNPVRRLAEEGLLLRSCLRTGHGERFSRGIEAWRLGANLNSNQKVKWDQQSRIDHKFL